MNPPKSSESTERPLVRRIPTGGDLLAMLGTIMRIQISSRETQGRFCVCEGRLPPSAFVPLHYHPDVELFLVPKGTLEVMPMASEKTESVSAATGEMALIPSDAVHGFRNTSGSHIQLLSVGGPGIESFLVEAGNPAPRTIGETEATGFGDLLRTLESANRHGQVFVGGR
jgi:quercetin dioxygenase-like cupin family protein